MSKRQLKSRTGGIGGVTTELEKLAGNRSELFQKGSAQIWTRSVFILGLKFFRFKTKSGPKSDEYEGIFDIWHVSKKYEKSLSVLNFYSET